MTAALAEARRPRRFAVRPDHLGWIGSNSRRASQVLRSIAPVTGSPVASWKERTAAVVCLPKMPVTGSCVSPAPTQVLLRPDDEVALAAALQQRVGDQGPVAEDRAAGRRAERRPEAGARLLPVPPARRQARRSCAAKRRKRSTACGPGLS